MSTENSRGPTPLEEAFQKLTTVIEAPTSGVRLLVRRISDFEVLTATQDLPTASMTQKEAEAYVSALDPDGRRDIGERSQRVHDRLLCLATLSPPISEEEPAPAGTLPIALLRHDRAVLVARILEFSRIGSAPPRDVPEPGPVPGPEVSAEQFRDAGAADAGLGGGERAAAVGGGEAQSG
jgi:hypothetical protein